MGSDFLLPSTTVILKTADGGGFFQVPSEIIRHNEKIPPESYT
jgi:hypothetical protein